MHSEHPTPAPALPPDQLRPALTGWIDETKLQDIILIDLEGKSTIADFMLVASGESSRQVIAAAERIVDQAKSAGIRHIRVEGMGRGDWVLIDLGDAIVHIFRPEVRAFYELEKMWSLDEAFRAEERGRAPLASA